MPEQTSPPVASNVLRIEVPATAENVGHTRRVVADFLSRWAWGADDADALLLAVGEACNNAVNYGGLGYPDPHLIVSCLFIPGRPLVGQCLQVDIRNQGNGFHPDLGRYGQMPEAEFATHGRGFGLMLALVDDVQVLSDGDNTVVRLTKSRAAA